MTAHPRAKEVTWDIEATGLLDDTTVDYTAIPYKLKDNFRIHVICVEEWSTTDDSSRIICFYDGPTIIFDGSAIEYKLEDGDHVLQGYTPVEYEHYPMVKFKSYVEKSLEAGRIRRIWGHNEINYDLLACDLVFDMPFDTDQMTWCGLKHKGFDDTFVRSKVQNADRIGGHGLDNLSKVAAAGNSSAATKYDFRPWLSGVEKFKEFGPDMVYYNILDVKSNTNVARYLLKEAGDWDWAPALHLERVVAEIVTRQTHRGFYFDLEQAQSNLEFLDGALSERDAIITPLIPPKQSTKAHQKNFTPPVKQFNKDGSFSAHLVKFAAKIGATLSSEALEYNGVTYPLPLNPESFVEAVAGSVKASIDDSTHIKGWLVSEHGWNPTEWKERDLSLDAKRKKLPRERVVEAIDRYVTQTLASPFKSHRLDYLECSEDQLRNKLLSVKDGKPIRVRTNPSLTVGQEKEVDPALAELQDRFPHAKHLIEYYTYKHRRNAILGGGLEYDEDEGFAEAEKGFMAAIRADGRVPTPADTCGAATGRMKHKIVCNIPRGTSLFGGEMRGMFCVNTNDPVYQLGYDFSSLEAGMEAHFCWKYDDAEQSYCKSLLLPKPNDVHCFDQETEILTSEGWKSFGDINGGSLVAQWDTNGTISFTKPAEIVWQPYKGDMISIESEKVSQLLTPNHRVVRRAYKDTAWSVVRAEHLAGKARQQEIPVAGVYDGGSAEKPYEFYELLVATQADGHLAADCSAITYSFTKERKINRLKQLLNTLDAPYTEHTHSRKGRTEVTIRLLSGALALEVREALGGRKTLPAKMLTNLPSAYMQWLLLSVGLWDGTVRKNGDIILDTTDENTRDVVLTLGVLSDKKVSSSSYLKTTSFSHDGVRMYRAYISVKSKPVVTIRRASVKTTHYVGMIGCVAVPTGFVVVRRNNKVFVSGNTKTAGKVSELIGKPFLRDVAKAVKYSCSYGAQPAKVAKIIGADTHTGEVVFEAFWEAAKPLAKLKDDLTKQWEKTGKKYIVGLDGRKIPTRAAHSIINSLFQSGGAIAAKRVMVEAWRRYKKKGWDLDFFRSDWTKTLYVQQMIAMHDEAQAEVSKSLVKWKKFVNAEEAKTFKQEQKAAGVYWSEATHEREDGSVFLGYSEVTQILWECVNKVSKDLKLNVPLAIEFVFGLNWRDCH